jgi:hypothetical protein
MAPDAPDDAARPAPAWPDARPGTPEQALDLVRSRYAGPTLPDGSPAELEAHEFEEGFLVRPARPPAADTGEQPRPAPPGGGQVVVCKETGETLTVPNLPTEAAVALFRRIRTRPR